MATQREYDLAVVTGSYTDPQTGQPKNRYQTIGTVLRKDDGGKFILLDPLINLAAVPRGQGKDRVMVSMFEPKEQQGQNHAQPEPPQNHAPQHNQAPQGQGYYNPDGSPMNPQQVAFAQSQHRR